MPGVGAVDLSKRHAPLFLAGRIHQQDPATAILHKQGNRYRINEVLKVRLGKTDFRNGSQELADVDFRIKCHVLPAETLSPWSLLVAFKLGYTLL